MSSACFSFRVRELLLFLPLARGARVTVAHHFNSDGEIVYDRTSGMVLRQHLPAGLAQIAKITGYPGGLLQNAFGLRLAVLPVHEGSRAHDPGGEK